MSFAEEVKTARSKAYEDAYHNFLDDFKSAKRTSRDRLVEDYEHVKYVLINVVNEYPRCDEHRLFLSQSIDSCYTLIDMLIEDGVTNFDLTPNCELFRRDFASPIDNYSYRTTDYYVVVKFPLDDNIFDATKILK